MAIGAKTKAAALVAAAAAPASAAPADRPSPLTGTWVAELSSQQGLPTDLYVVRDGIYPCDSCVPRRRYPADGRPHRVSEAPPATEAVTILDARTISTRIVRPDVDRTTRMRVARDGRTATYVSIDRRPGVKGRLRTEYLAARIAPGPPGAHAVSGTWRGIRYVSVPVQLRTTVLHDSGGRLSYRTGIGYSYDAPFSGAFVPIVGPYDGSLSVSVRKLDSGRLEETRRKGGADVQVRTYTLDPSGRRMEIATTDLATGTTFKIVARRQR